MVRALGIRGFLGLALLAGSGAALAEGSATGFEGLTTASSNELATTRGADGNLTLIESTQNFSSKVEGASFTAGTISNGNINIGERAFDGFSGIGVNVMNTGNSTAISAGVTAVINLH